MATKEKAPVAYASAMDKIRDEMAKSRSNYVRVVGEYLSDYLLDHPEAEGAILTEGKTIQGSLAAMRKAAEKMKEGNVAVLDDATGFRIVREYFGIGETGDATAAGDLIRQRQGAATVPEGKAFGEAKTSAGADISNSPFPISHSQEPDPFDLDALLGGGTL